MGRSVARKLIDAHLVDAEDVEDSELALKIDQALLQDATGTLVMLALEAMQLEQAQTEIAVQYVDHNLLQEDHRNPEDHIFLESAAKRFGFWFSQPGNGVSHPLHQASFGVPGKTLIGSDSHTPAAGALGMLAFGAGGLDVAMAIAGEPYRIRKPKVWGVRLSGELPAQVSAKDIILEMLRRHDVSGGRGHIIEYHGPGLDGLGAMDRHVIANMGTELGATTSVFPSDTAVKNYLECQGRGHDWQELTADADAAYDVETEIDLSGLEPLIAEPSSPGNVVPVRQVAGRDVYQGYIGSSANPGFRDFAAAAEMVRNRKIAPGVSFDINPTSRKLLEALIDGGYLGSLLNSGGRLHQAGCNGCIGMGQAPARGRNSLRTVPRNFPGRSGAHEDSVYLCSPETVAAAVLTGCITDPREFSPARAAIDETDPDMNIRNFCTPPPAREAGDRSGLEKGENISTLPAFDALPDTLRLSVLLKVGDDLSTDEILPAGAEVLPYRSNIEKISRFCFRDVAPAYYDEAARAGGDGHAIVAGRNYGQGSSREHAALAPRFLGLRCVIAKSFSRIHRQNLINYGVLPLVFSKPEALDRLRSGQEVKLSGLHDAIAGKDELVIEVLGEDKQEIWTELELTGRERDILSSGGRINQYLQNRKKLPQG